MSDHHKAAADADAHSHDESNTTGWNRQREFGEWSLFLSGISAVLAIAFLLLKGPGTLTTQPTPMLLAVGVGALAATGLFTGVLGCSRECEKRKQAALGAAIHGASLLAVIVYTFA